MMLLTAKNRKSLPALYANEKLGDEAIVLVKFFTPDGRWTWYATEFDGEDTFFGLVSGMVEELGTFSLSELASARGPLGLAIERDRYFTPKTIRECRTPGAGPLGFSGGAS